MSEEETDETADYAKSSLQLAIETNDPEDISALDKSETIFYVCHVLGVEPPESHPNRHNGTVPKSVSQKWAQVLGDYTDRTGADAFDPSVLEDEGDDGEDDGEDGSGGSED